MFFIYYLILINVIAFIVYGIDKRKAKKEKWRIPERTLIFLAVIGGAIGALIGMLLFHHKTRKPRFTKVYIMGILWVLILIWGTYQNHHLVVTTYNVASDKIAKGESYRIVQVSDLHNQWFGLGSNGLVEKVKRQLPDIIVCTGDMVDREHPWNSVAINFFKGAVKIAPTYYVSGNHDVEIDGYEDFLKEIEDLDVHVINDKVAELDQVTLLGIDDESLNDSPDSIKERLGEYDTSKPVVALVHEPEPAKKLTNLDADVILTGHLHGGQVIFPWNQALIVPNNHSFPHFFVKEYKGAKRIGDKTTLIINRGLGNSILPLRINDYPEIVVVELYGTGK